MIKDFFIDKAAGYDKAKHRTANVDNIASAILAAVDLRSSQYLLDFGSGTGLLLARLAPYVNKITAVDVSASMNAQLEGKRTSLPCELQILAADLTRESLSGEYDVIVSSMTLHHIADMANIFSRLYKLLGNGGVIALADLDLEDGSFHQEDTGVFHHGFDRAYLREIAQAVGFQNINIETASMVYKPQGDYSVFLLTASK